MFQRFRLASAALLTCAVASAAAPTAAVSLEVDAREAPVKLFHARLRLPARPGPLTLLYPKWLPGEHGPTGPIGDLTGLRITAGGQPVAWKRDTVDMFAFHVQVPPSAEALEISLDLLSPATTGNFASSAASATPQLAVISWNQVLLYPQGSAPDELSYAATLRLPAGWKYGTSLSAGREGPEGIVFAPVSLTTLIDSPVLAGAHLAVVELTGAPVPHRLQMAADSEAALAIKPEEVARYQRLVAETGALFGARHYGHYDFLLTLSDHVAHFGLEHHESSDDRVEERSLVDPDQRRMMAGLLPHEMVHSWNGKYRRPAGLRPGRFDEPMNGELLWVYEGLTEYLGQILTARSGLLSPEEYRESLAQTAAEMDFQRGRAWRPLADTAIAAQVLFETRQDGASWRRSTDFYAEGELLWLEADTVIRRETAGRRSLDDFCRLFHGGASGPPRVMPYTFEDVVTALNQVAPYDWAGFWRVRLDATGLHAPLEGIAGSGWKLAWSTSPSEMQQAAEETGKSLDARFSIGFSVQDDGDIADVIPQTPAALAGIGPGTKLIAVNGRRFTRDTLREALRDSARRPIELLVESGEFFQTHRLEYTGGERYPRLERDESRPDVLSQIVRPLTSTPPSTGR